MVLTTDQILEYTREPQNKELKKFREEHKTLNFYYNGGKVEDHISRIANYENEYQEKLRKNIARSTKDTLQKILNPFSKIFSAQGGNIQLDIDNDSRKEEFLGLLQNLPNKISLSEWMRVHWFEAYVTDPNGIVLIEATKDEQPVTYPTYKNINSIIDYSTTFNNIDYIILDEGEKEVNGTKRKIYRLIDDESDILYYIEDEKVIEFEQEDQPGKINHNKGFVPALIVSDLVSNNHKGKHSFISKIDELLKEYLLESSVLSIFKFLHAYPIYWQYSTKCTQCLGDGYIKNERNGEVSRDVCPSCKGTGLRLIKDVSNGITLPLPKGDAPTIAPNVAGYVEPPIDAWDKMEKSKEVLEGKMFYALWGTYLAENNDTEKTATQSFIDSQPINDELCIVQDSRITIENTIADFMAKWMYDNDYGAINIFGGKRFLVESPDALLKKYLDAKESKAPVSILDSLYKEFLLSQYQNDFDMYDKKIKEFQIEPIPHFEISELVGVIPNNELSKKIFFSEWLALQEDFTKDVSVLKSEFETFINNKNLVYDEKREES